MVPDLHNTSALVTEFGITFMILFNICSTIISQTILSINRLLNVALIGMGLLQGRGSRP